MYPNPAGSMSSSPPNAAARKTDKLSRSNQPSNPNSSPRDQTERSTVDCYTCRRRHVKCDRIISPTGCSKCAKKGVRCLGYQKPLRWADGVAVRGKFKGKSQPVVDSEVMSIVRDTMQLQSKEATKEATKLEHRAVDTAYFDESKTQDMMLELMQYHNSTMCAEHATFNVPFEQWKVVNRVIAPLSPDVMQRLPKDIVNCVLGNAAVHMASRQRGSRSLEKLALEAKANVFESFNRLLQSPQNQRPDVIICIGLLIFAMDLFEHGMNRWAIHFTGSMNVMQSFGGIDNLVKYYPSLQLPLTCEAYFETFWIFLSHVPTTKAKMASRETVERLCHESLSKQKFYNPCPPSLTLAVWDIGSLSSRILQTRDGITVRDMYKRDKILLDVIAYQPNTQADHMKGTANAELQLREWINTAWKSAITILVLRYLYFGRPNLAPQIPEQSFANEQNPWFRSEDLGPYYQGSEESIVDDFFSEMGDTDNLHERRSTGLSLRQALSRSSSPLPFTNSPDHLSTGYYPTDPFSQSPSPLPSPQIFQTPPDSGLWEKRYEIHDEAFSTLSSTLFGLHDIPDTNYVRYILMPLLILALVSRQGSPERTLCFSYFSRFKEHMAKNYPPGGVPESPSPQGGEALDFDISWDKLDAYSARIEEKQRGHLILDDAGLKKGAPEWNWWDMLNEIQIDVIWPISAGTALFERGTEFEAFTLLSSVVNEECFSHWMQDEHATQALASSS